MTEHSTPRSIIGATNLIFLDNQIYKVEKSLPDESGKDWAIAQAIAHTTFGSPTKEEMIGIKSQYAFWQEASQERAKRISSFLLELDIEVPELGITKNTNYE